MSGQNFLIKKIEEKDLSKIVEVHIDAFENSLNIRAGKKYLLEFFRWFIVNDGIYLKAELNNEIVGYVIGAPIGYEKKMNKNLFLYAFFGLLIRPHRVLNKSLIRNIFKRIKIILSPNSIVHQPLNDLGFGFSLVGIAAAKKAQGTPVAKDLIDAFEKRAFERNADFIRLSVLSENKRAMSFYAKNGWTKHDAGDGIYFFKQRIVVSGS